MESTFGVSTTHKEQEKRNEKKEKQVIIDRPSPIACPETLSMICTAGAEILQDRRYEIRLG
jgi:hypothetical protein